MSRAQWRRLGWVAVLLCAAIPLSMDSATRDARGTTLTTRLLGPLARRTAFLQWVRVDLAIRAGRTDLALARSEAAIELDPSYTRGWFLLSHHLAFELASPERELDATARARWVRSGLAIAARGEAVAAEPQELALWQGLILARTAEVDPGIPWEGGVEAMWTSAIEAFERSAHLGDPDAPAAATRARAVLEALRKQ